jgi:hypothetical protein
MRCALQRSQPHLRRSAKADANQHDPMLQRNPVYTGVARGKRLEVLIE